MKRIIIASNNQGKMKEFKSLLEPLNYEVLGLKDVDYHIDIIEDGSSFKENALIKAKTIANHFKMPALADDSGLEVKALNNEPGIYSARYAGTYNDSDNNALLIQKMKNIKQTDARYVCAICLYYPNDEYIIVEDYCYGNIIDTPRGTNGFGYDSYFYLKDYGKTMAEITLEQKNKISHRAKALTQIINILNEDK